MPAVVVHCNSDDGRVISEVSLNDYLAVRYPGYTWELEILDSSTRYHPAMLILYQISDVRLDVDEVCHMEDIVGRVPLGQSEYDIETYHVTGDMISLVISNYERRGPTDWDEGSCVTQMSLPLTTPCPDKSKSTKPDWSQSRFNKFVDKYERRGK